MSKLFTCAVLHPLSHDGEALKAGDKVDLTAKELNQLLSLKEQPVQDPRKKDVDSIKDDANDKEPLTEAQIVEAIGKLDPANDKHFTKGNKPNANVLADMLNQDVSAAERDAAWETHQANAVPPAGSDNPSGEDSSDEE